MRAICARSLQRGVAPPISRSVSGKISPTFSGRRRGPYSASGIGSPIARLSTKLVPTAPAPYSSFVSQSQGFLPSPGWGLGRRRLPERLAQTVDEDLLLIPVRSRRQRGEGRRDPDA